MPQLQYVSYKLYSSYMTLFGIICNYCMPYDKVAIQVGMGFSLLLYIGRSVLTLVMCVQLNYIMYIATCSLTYGKLIMIVTTKAKCVTT